MSLHWDRGGLNREIMDIISTSVPNESHLSPHSDNLVSPHKSLVPLEDGQTSTGAQSKQVWHHTRLLMSMAPLIGVCS